MHQPSFFFLPVTKLILMQSSDAPASVCLPVFRETFRPVPPELSVDKVTWLLSDMQHAEVDMRRLILDLVDEKVFHVQKGQDEESDSRWAVRDKTEQYSALQPKVTTGWCRSK